MAVDIAQAFLPADSPLEDIVRSLLAQATVSRTVNPSSQP